MRTWKGVISIWSAYIYMSETHGGPQVELMLSLGMRHPQGPMHHVHRLLHTGHGITEHLCTGSGHVRIGTHGLSLSSPGCDPTLGNSWGNLWLFDSNDLDNITGSVGPLLLQKKQLRPRWQIFERKTWGRSWQCTGSRHISSEEDSPGCRFNILWSSSQVRELNLQEMLIWESSTWSTSLCVSESENWAWLWMISEVTSFNWPPRSCLWTSSPFRRSLFRHSVIVPSLPLLLLRPLRADIAGRIITVNAMRFNWKPQMILLVRSMRSDQQLWCRACCCCECVLREKLILWMAGRRKGILERAGGLGRN
jgi:hypothetical protein